MVKVAFAGGAGNVAQEVIDILLAEQKHEVLILSRKDAPSSIPKGVSWAKTTYEDPKQLAEILQGVHTLLSFATTQDDPSATVQKNLITAAVQAGVKRFAPSEWSTARFDHLPWYAFKEETRRYLKELNKDKKVLEYTLFHPGLFLNYWTSPYQSSKHVKQLQMPIDFYNRRALTVDGSEDDVLTLTTAQDVANVVVRAIEYEGEWPLVSGIRGANVTIGQLIALGEKIRGGPFAVERIKAEDFEKNTWTSSWVPKLDHPSIPLDQVDVYSKMGAACILLAISAGAYNCSDEWNHLLPDYEFTQPEEFLTAAWRGKP